MQRFEHAVLRSIFIVGLTLTAFTAFADEAYTHLPPGATLSFKAGADVRVMCDTGDPVPESKVFCTIRRTDTPSPFAGNPSATYEVVQVFVGSGATTTNSLYSKTYNYGNAKNQDEGILGTKSELDSLKESGVCPKTDFVPACAIMQLTPPTKYNQGTGKPDENGTQTVYHYGIVEMIPGGSAQNILWEYNDGDQNEASNKKKLKAKFQELKKQGLCRTPDALASPSNDAGPKPPKGATATADGKLPAK